MHSLTGPRAPARFERLLLALATLLIALILPRTARAQDTTEPWVLVTPADVTLTSPTLFVTIKWNDDLSLATTTREIRFNGVNVTSQFAHTAITSGGFGGVQGTSTGTLNLSPGVDTLTASICDNAGNCSAPYNYTYTYVAGDPAVKVTQDGGAPAEVLAGVTDSVSFKVYNTGSAAGTFRMRAECREGWAGTALSSCVVSNNTSVIQAGDSMTIRVRFPTGTAGGTLLIRLSASVDGMAGMADAGWRDVVVTGTGGSPAAMLVQAVDLNSGSQIDRSQCVTVSAGAGAAYECGDLRLVAAAPGIILRGKARAPVLLYNSQHASPRPTVYADVTLPATAGEPTYVDAVVKSGGVTLASRTYPGGDWSPGTTRRVALQWPGSGTGLVPYTLEVTARYGSTQYPSSAVTGSIAVVDRSASAFGSGWWMSGLERVMTIPGDTASRLWIGGDGSTRVYSRTAAGIYVAPSIDTPDTLRYVGTSYERRARGGVRVGFDATGIHRWTANRLRDTTRFGYDGSNRLTSITLPRRGTYSASDSIKYRFHYDAQGRIDTLTAPTVPGQTRTLSFAYMGSTDKRIRAIRGADTLSVQFAYGMSSRPNVVTSRTDRARVPVTFVFADSTQKLASVSITADTGAVVTNTFEAAEGKGITSSIAQVQAYTRLDGPRTDVQDQTLLWLTRWAAPRRIRDATGMETILNRTEASLPGLVTELWAPNDAGTAIVRRAATRYDARGRVFRSVNIDKLGNAKNDTTWYTYDDRWDAVASITVTADGQQGGVVTMEYDTLGNRTWEQLDNASRRVNYRYYTSGPAIGMMRAVQSPAVGGVSPVDSVAYDARGNLRATVSPLGFISLTLKDDLGRDTLILTPISPDSAISETLVADTIRSPWQRIQYDVMDRAWRTTSYGPARNHATSDDGFIPLASVAERLVVVTEFDPEGRPITVTRTGSSADTIPLTLETFYAYDYAGRKTFEVLGAQTQRYSYDAAGNVVQWRTPQNRVITSEYDVLGRKTRQIVPAVSYAQEDLPVAWVNQRTFPSRPNNGTGYRIPADTSEFRYDLHGRMVYAANRDAVIQRSYFPGGMLRTDSTWLRDYSDGEFSQSYGLEYTYDVLGRLIRLRHPSNLSGTAQADTFAYDAITSALTYARDRSNVGFTFVQDVAGRPVSTHLPGGQIDSLVYDIEGRVILRMRGSASLPGNLQNDSLRYDARGKIVRVDTRVSPANSYVQWYTGMGSLAATEWDNQLGNGTVREQFRMDALGNVRQRRNLEVGEFVSEDPHFRTTLDPTYGRVTGIVKQRTNPAPNMSYPMDETGRSYDGSGNVAVGWETRGWVSDGVQRVVTRSYYGADDRLVAVNTRDETQPQDIQEPVTEEGVWEEYRYDALGRRVLVRSVRSGLCTGNNCPNLVTRFLWAGDQILWELRAPGGDADNLEATTGTGEQYGRVSYFHAGGIDRPLTITKLGIGTIVTHENWRGQLASGTWAIAPTGSSGGDRSDCYAGAPSSCAPVNWPGWRTSAYNRDGDNSGVPGDARYWFGSLASGMEDASGQQYMRNRYFDPKTGQFTQADPIGLGGGLNAYGFAQGDPVSYSDPYGLTVKFRGDKKEARRIWNQLREQAQAAAASEDEQVRAAANRTLANMATLENSKNVFTFNIQYENESNFRLSLGSGAATHEQGWLSRALPHRYFKIDMNPVYFRNRWGIRPEIGLAHEIGHAAAVEAGETPPMTVWGGVDGENDARRIYGCTNLRIAHSADGGPCQ